MKYEPPIVAALSDRSSVPICNSGSSADTSGCTNGPSVAGWCTVGSSDGACADGNNASLCGMGFGGGGDYTRCVSGTVVG